MDEPTSALDPISTSKIEDLAMELKKDYVDRKVVVPGKTLNEISKILSGEIDDIVNIYFSKKSYFI